jgi:branched-chain amino acid transport system permease protein
MKAPRSIPWTLLVLALLLVYPFLTFIESFLNAHLQMPIGTAMPVIFIYCILALGLNVVVGDTGLLHLGIGACFGIGAFITGILMIQANPFQLGLIPTMLIAILGTTFIGLILSAPTLRLRGDYLALVTMGFGLIAVKALINFDAITGGTQTLGPIPPPRIPAFLHGPLDAIGLGADWKKDYRLFYFWTLAFLILVFILLYNLERSRLGRAWVAMREDELAATCMGVNAARLKLGAFALGTAIAALAGVLYAVKSGNSQDPEHYGFNKSITLLCCLILGGLGSRKGAILGVFLIVGFDNIFAPLVDGLIQKAKSDAGVAAAGKEKVYLTFSGWKLMLYGLVLILMMRFRSSGLIPARREHPVPPNPVAAEPAAKEA